MSESSLPQPTRLKRQRKRRIWPESNLGELFIGYFQDSRRSSEPHLEWQSHWGIARAWLAPRNRPISGSASTASHGLLGAHSLTSGTDACFVNRSRQSASGTDATLFPADPDDWQ